MLPLDEINKKIEVPVYDSSTPVKPIEAAFIFNFLKENNISSTLEVGLAYARSASHIIAATGKRHIAIDPFQEKYGDRGIENLMGLGFLDFLDFRRDYSHNILPRLKDEGVHFDFIFIDGDHKFDGEFIDFYYSDLLLNDKGYILLHDTWMRSTRLLMSFIRSNRKDYRKIPTPLRNLALYQKVGKDARNGMFFKEFYTFRSILSHNMILWMTSGRNHLIKKILFKIKEFVK